MSIKKPNPTNNDNTATDAAIKSTGKTVISKSGLIFSKKKVVTVPVLKLMPGVAVYIKVEQVMEVSKQVKQKEVGGKIMDPATIMHCTNLENDEECIVIIGKALEGSLNDNYPNDSYVGKSFEILNSGKLGDKKYNTYSVTEVEIEY